MKSKIKRKKKRRVSFINKGSLYRPTLNPSTTFINEPVQMVIPKSVYDYASLVHQTLEGPRQTKLDHDISTVLGTSDPPPGFGFLHPRFYYLEQKRPIPLKPLQVSIENLFFNKKKKRKKKRNKKSICI